MWLILIVDMLFWGLVMPPIAVVMWLPLRLIARTCPPSPEFFLKVETPWDILLHAWIRAHGLRIVDEDGSTGLFVPGVASLTGAFLMNHRSFGDFVIE